MPLSDFFAHLKGGSGILETTDIISLLSAMLGWWANNPRVPEYFNRLKDAQKKSVRAKLPINDMWLAAIATGLLLAVGGCPKQCPNWDSLPRTNKTWAAFNTNFRNHQLTLKCEQCVTEEREDVFGSAATAITIHGISAATATPGALITPNTLVFHALSAAATTPTRDFSLQASDSHLDRMADAATNSGLTLFQLTNANTCLTSTTTTQYEAI